MSAPAISLTVEPSEAGTVLYLPLAAKTANDTPAAQLSLQLMINNNGNSSLHLNTIALAFTPPSAPAVSLSANLDIPPQATTEWNFLVGNDANGNPIDQNQILPVPVPDAVTLRLFCDGFTDPAEVSLPLAPHAGPNPAGSYRFPSPSPVFFNGEFWQGRSAVHGSGVQGSQLFAYDLGVVAFDVDKMYWSPLLAGTPDTENSNFRIWGKHVCAMADGTVLEAVNDVPNNPHPLHWASQADLDQQLQQQMQNYWGTFPHGGAGNHFYLQHGEEVVLYAHLQQGSLNQQLLTPGAQVSAGTFLGSAGNSGNATAPHLHIHSIKGTQAEVGPLRPLPFHDALAIDQSVLTAPYPQAPWSKLEDAGLPAVTSLIWPALILAPPPRMFYEVAIDPLALVLREDIYVKIHTPDPGPIELLQKRIRDFVRSLLPEQKRIALERVRSMAVYTRVLEQELSKSEKSAG